MTTSVVDLKPEQECEIDALLQGLTDERLCALIAERPVSGLCGLIGAWGGQHGECDALKLLLPRDKQLHPCSNPVRDHFIHLRPGFAHCGKMVDLHDAIPRLHALLGGGSTRKNALNQRVIVRENQEIQPDNAWLCWLNNLFGGA
jgi:hypothetical protein